MKTGLFVLSAIWLIGAMLIDPILFVVLKFPYETSFQIRVLHIGHSVALALLSIAYPFKKTTP